MQIADFQRVISAKLPSISCQLDPLDEQALVVSKGAIPELMAWLKDDPDTDMQFLEFITCVDYPPERLRLVYSLFSFTHNHRLLLKVDLSRDSAQIPTVSHLWQTANWNEREVYDLFGVTFLKHPDLRRILMPEDWEGAPLRKDYTHPNLVHRPEE